MKSQKNILMLREGKVIALVVFYDKSDLIFQDFSSWNLADDKDNLELDDLMQQIISSTVMLEEWLINVLITSWNYFLLKIKFLEKVRRPSQPASQRKSSQQKHEEPNNDSNISNNKFLITLAPQKIWRSFLWSNISRVKRKAIKSDSLLHLDTLQNKKNATDFSLGAVSRQSRSFDFCVQISTRRQLSRLCTYSLLDLSRAALRQQKYERKEIESTAKLYPAAKFSALSLFSESLWNFAKVLGCRRNVKLETIPKTREICEAKNPLSARLQRELKN